MYKTTPPKALLYFWTCNKHTHQSLLQIDKGCKTAQIKAYLTFLSAMNKMKMLNLFQILMAIKGIITDLLCSYIFFFEMYMDAKSPT